MLETIRGSVVGYDHLYCGKVLVGKNAQDAIAVGHSDKLLVAVVTDGCGSGKHSEVGAEIGANLLVQYIRHQYDRYPTIGPELVNVASDDVAAHIRILARQFPGSLTEVINDYFLFSTMIFVASESYWQVYSLGDGVFGSRTKRDEVVELKSCGPYPNNAPPYLAYRLVNSSIDPDHLSFKFVDGGSTDDLDTVVIGSDGVCDLDGIAGDLIPGTKEIVGPMSQFWDGNEYFENPYNLRRKLHRINTTIHRLDQGRIMRHPGLLPDDTSLFIARRRDMCE